MQAAAANPTSTIRAATKQGSLVPVRLWQSLTDAWLRHLDRRVGTDVRWLDHDGVAEDFRSASHG